MLLTDEQIKVRIESPLNLLNRLRLTTKTHESQIVTIPQEALQEAEKLNQIVAIPPTADQLIENLEEKISKKNYHTSEKARLLLNNVIDELSLKIPEVEKPEKLAAIAREMSTILKNEDDLHRGVGPNTPQIVVYAPTVRDEREFVMINVQDKEESER